MWQKVREKFIKTKGAAMRRVSLFRFHFLWCFDCIQLTSWYLGVSLLSHNQMCRIKASNDF